MMIVKEYFEDLKSFRVSKGDLGEKYLRKDV